MATRRSQGERAQDEPRPCEKTSEAIVVDGGKRGQVVKVCPDPTCRLHHPERPSAEQLQRARAEERKRIEKEKLAITIRHRILATILERVSAPLKKADLLLVARCLVEHLPHTQVEVLAKRHKLDIEKPGQVPQQIISKHVGTYDEEGLCRMLLEISLLDSASLRNSSGGDDLLSTAKSYRVDAGRQQRNPN